MPPKALYDALRNDASTEFAFELARELGMTVEHMSRVMPHREYVQWGVYFGLLRQREELARKNRR
jgi:hypothetical protein